MTIGKICIELLLLAFGYFGHDTSQTLNRLYMSGLVRPFYGLSVNVGHVFTGNHALNHSVDVLANPIAIMGVLSEQLHFCGGIRKQFFYPRKQITKGFLRPVYFLALLPCHNVCFCPLMKIGEHIAVDVVADGVQLFYLVFWNHLHECLIKLGIFAFCQCPVRQIIAHKLRDGFAGQLFHFI